MWSEFRKIEFRLKYIIIKTYILFRFKTETRLGTRLVMFRLKDKVKKEENHIYVLYKMMPKYKFKSNLV